MKLQQLLPSLWLTGSVSAFVVQPAWAQVVQVTGVQLNPTPTGLEVILETANGSLPQVFSLIPEPATTETPNLQPTEPTPEARTV